MFGKLNQEWHGVPVGTKLEIIQTFISFGDRVYDCRRIDGEYLPGPWGLSRDVRIVVNFVDII